MKPSRNHPDRSKPGTLLLAALLGATLAYSAGILAKVTPRPPTVTAGSWVLVDFHTNQVLAGKDQERAVEPASLTKIMEAFTVFDELAKNNVKLDEKVRISANAWKTPGSRMFVEVDTEVTVEELLNGIIVQSGNDASVALAEHIAGSEETFAELMNQHAAAIGMKNSHFTNSTGLPHDQHYSTALDLATLAAAMIRQFPNQYRRFAEKSYAYNGITQHNRNRLLWWDKSVDGVKTGHTETAGYCLVASAAREDMRLVLVLTGGQDDKSRFQEAQSLLNYGFRFFQTHKLVPGKAAQTRVPVLGGAQDDVALGLGEDLYVTIPSGSYDDLKASMEIHPSIPAPVAAGSELGTLKVTLQGKDLLTRPLIALEEVGEGSLFKQWKDSFFAWLEK